jgi:hypothetical protein
MQNAQLIRSTASILLQRGTGRARDMEYNVDTVIITVLEKGVFRFQAPVHEVRALQKRVLQGSQLKRLRDVCLCTYA